MKIVVHTEYVFCSQDEVNDYINNVVRQAWGAAGATVRDDLRAIRKGGTHTISTDGPNGQKATTTYTVTADTEGGAKK